MNELSFEVIDPYNKDQAKSFVEWYKNPLMVRNWTLQNEDTKEVTYTLENFREQFSPKDKEPEKYTFMINVDGKYIGYGQFYINHRMCMIKDAKVCWPSIAIGEDSYRGKGFGLKICMEILRIAKEMDCTHIEAGVFEFNTKMKSLLINNGFKLIGKQKRKTFVDDKWWASEHYALDLRKGLNK